MRLLCPAKINLHLRVGPRRGDGFHSLLSWFCTVGLFDTLTLEHASRPPADGLRIALSCDQPDLPCGLDNLVVKVGEAWADEALQTPRAAAIRANLEKHIPSGAGLGGGSSDGARMLAGLNSLWNTGRAADYLSGFAARFGSDLPFFFHGPSSVCTGRGEVVRPIQPPSPKWAVLILPAIHMPTADVYRRFDAMGLGRDEDLQREPDWSAWSGDNAVALMEKLINDLEAPAFAISPALAGIRAAAEQILGRNVRMSGSGSSLFSLYDRRLEAESARGALQDGMSGRCEVVSVAPEFVDDLNAPVAVKY